MSSLADKLSTGFAGASAAVACVAILVSCQTADDQSADQKATEKRQANAARQQAQFQTNIEERQSAPRLTPGVRLSDRGKMITVYPDSGGRIRKRADRLTIERNPPYRIVMPVRNVGLGVAILLQEYVSTVETCHPPPGALDRADVERLGFYALKAGDTDQLVYLPRPEFAEVYHAAGEALNVNLLLRYTDVLGRKLRWTCVSYARSGRHESWAVAEPVYGDAHCVRRLRPSADRRVSGCARWVEDI
jgi:hypothetical protein